MTAIESLVLAIYKRFGYANCGDMIEDIRQAKAIEKQQIVKAVWYGHDNRPEMIHVPEDFGEQYYNSLNEKK